MISPEHFIAYLESKGFHFYTGVPCSYFKTVIRFLEGHKSSSYYIAPNEGSALALASGSFLGGQQGVVLIQNSGLGNLINPLTSLNLIYRLPVVLFVSGRAYEIDDEPQHEIMGKSMGKLLDTVGISHWDLPPDNETFKHVLERGIMDGRRNKIPVAFFVRRGTFGAYPSDAVRVESNYPMQRIEAIKSILEFISKDDLIFSTTGKISRELFAVGDRPGNFYMQGSMGHIGSLALGTALSQRDRRVIVLDGDGALLMHLGALSAVGHYQPERFYHFILDNEAYESTGNQDTVSPTADFAMIAQACDYRATWNVSDSGQLRSVLPDILNQKGPVLLRIKINRIETKEIPRITTCYTAPEITESFKQFIQSSDLVKPKEIC